MRWKSPKWSRDWSRDWSGRVSCTFLQLMAFLVLLLAAAVILTLKGY